MNEQEKYEVIKKLVETNGNKHRAAAKLGCSLRHVNRLIARYQTEGKVAFIHGNRGRKPACAIADSIKKDILCLYDTKYQDANLRHFTELLQERESIRVSETTVRKLLLAEGILSPKARRATRKALKQRLRDEQRSTKTKKAQARIQEKIAAVDALHPRRPRCANFGEMLQMDASVHLWFGGGKSHLHAAIDDATGRIVGAYFDKQETLDGYYQVFRQILERYGIPYLFYTDRRTIFDYKRADDAQRDIEKNTLTQFGYACKQLGVELKVTSVPQAKGRIERLFGTLQSRLPIELRLAGVTTIEQANEFLPHYLDQFNSQFALSPDSIKSVFETQPSSEEIDLYLSVLTERKIDPGHCIRYDNRYFKLLDGQGLDCSYHKGTPAMVIRTLSKALYASVGEEIHVLEELPEHERASRYFSTKKVLEEHRKPKKRYIPSMSHPWRRDNFMKYVHAMVGREEHWAC